MRKHVPCRGGIPICFPQFGDMGPVKAQHGFARNSQFAVVHASEGSVVLSLTPSEEQLQGSFPEHRLSVKVQYLPYPFKLHNREYRSTCGLSCRLEQFWQYKLTAFS